MIINVKTSTNNYDVIILKNSLENADKYLDLNKKVLIITDSGVPLQYVDTLKRKCLNPFVFTIKQGEKSKNIDNYQKIIEFMIANDFSRSDIIVALGGGVVGDLSGFVAATFNRGIKFYNIPTTLLSQVDSSIGGKTAIDFQGYKNIIGSFYPPSKVLIDSSTLNTLSKKQLHSGLVEVIKMAFTCNEKLFELINNSSDLLSNIDNIIYQALQIKKSIVEQDEKEANIRKVLNFGHSIGHAIESYNNLNLLHGECVGLGMLYMTNKENKQKLISILKKYDLPISIKIDNDKIMEIIKHDKKVKDNSIDIIFVNKIGTYEIKTINIKDIYFLLKEGI